MLFYFVGYPSPYCRNLSLTILLLLQLQWCSLHFNILLFTQYKSTAAATAKSLQSCLTLHDPIDGSPPLLDEMSCQSRFDARYWMLGAGALGRPRGMDWGGRKEEGSGWGTHVYLWWIHFDIWQNQNKYLKFKNKIKLKKKKKR